MPPLASFADVLARPLFAETRRPPILSAPAGDARSSAFTLVGIVISAREHLALLAHGQPSASSASRRSRHRRMSVEKILPDRVVLARADARIEVKAKDAPGVGSGPLRAPIR
ncbi:MAG TPA: hypothetical protein VF113_05965 [Stellaceae bacterium]